MKILSCSLILFYSCVSVVSRAQKQTPVTLNGQPSPSQYQWQTTDDNPTLTGISSGLNYADFASSVSKEATNQVLVTQGRQIAQIAAGTLVVGNGTPDAGTVDATNQATTLNIWQNMQRRIDWFQSHIVHSNIADNTAKALNTYNKTKNLIGQLGASFQNFSQMANQFNKDRQSKTSYTQQIVQEATNFLSWNDALAGFNGKPTSYTPIFNFLAAYDVETSRFRDQNGNISLATGVLTATSDQALMSHMSAYNTYLLNVNQKSGILNDMEIRTELQEAIRCERAARWLNLKINMELWGRGVKDVAASFQALANAKWNFSPDTSPSPQGTNSSDITSKLLAGTFDVSTLSSGSSVSATDHELLQQVEMMNKMNREASMHRGNAMRLMQQLMYAQMNPANTDIMLMKRIALASENLVQQNLKTYSSSNSYNNSVPITSGTPISTSQLGWQNGQK